MPSKTPAGRERLWNKPSTMIDLLGFGRIDEQRTPTARQVRRSPSHGTAGRALRFRRPQGVRAFDEHVVQDVLVQA